MSRSLTPFEKLKIITLLDPAPYSPDSENCALIRAWRSVGGPKLTQFNGGLTGVGVAMGFTAAEAMGIMDGWDQTGIWGRDYVKYGDEESTEGYGRGWEYGRELRVAVLERDARVTP